MVDSKAKSKEIKYFDLRSQRVMKHQIETQYLMNKTETSASLGKKLSCHVTMFLLH